MNPQIQPAPEVEAHLSRLDVVHALYTVIDPELGVNIVDLGLVFGIRVDGSRVEIDLTMTTPACPLSGYITNAVHAALRPLSADIEVHVDIVWDPRWSPHMMSADLRRPRRHPRGGSIYM